MQEYKIVFAGSMGAGKTTAIETLSDEDVISTDVINTDKESHSKALTTVGIDYGQITLPPDMKISLYGTPGQERFQMIWGVVTQGALGAIILIDSSSSKAPEELPFYVDFFKQKGMESIVIGLTHTDISDSHLTLDNAVSVLSEHDLVYPVFAVDGREKSDILLLTETLLASIEASIS